MSILNFIKILNVFFIIFKFYSVSNLMSNFITKILNVDFLTSFKVVEFEHEFEPGDLGDNYPFGSQGYLGSTSLVAHPSTIHPGFTS